jgi:hypothetical protein
MRRQRGCYRDSLKVSQSSFHTASIKCFSSNVPQHSECFRDRRTSRVAGPKTSDPSDEPNVMLKVIFPTPQICRMRAPSYSWAVGKSATNVSNSMSRVYWVSLSLPAPHLWRLPNRIGNSGPEVRYSVCMYEGMDIHHTTHV